MKSLQNSNILFAGPFPPPVTGQSFSFAETCSIINCKKKFIVNQNFEGNSVFTKFIKTLFQLPKYLVIITFNRIDLVYFTGTRSFHGSIKDLVLMLIALLCKKKIINHIHGADFKAFIEKLPPGYKQLILFAYRRIDCHLILLEQMREQTSFFPHNTKVEVVANFYDPLLDIIPFEKRNDDEITICYFSNVVYSKGIFDLIQAFNKLNSRHKNVTLQIAGKYMSDDYMTAEQVSVNLAAEIINNKNISYKGVLTGKDKRSFLASSHIFILPTFYKSEAFPISILEAMRCGCVLICSDHNYLKYVISDQNGSLVAARDIHGLSNAIQNYVDDPALMLKIAAFNMEFAKENYSRDFYGKQMNALFEEVLTS